MSDKKKMIYAIVYSGLLLIATLIFVVAVNIDNKDNMDSQPEFTPTPTITMLPTVQPTKIPQQSTITPEATPTFTPTPTPEPEKILKDKLLDERLASEIGSDFLAIRKETFNKFNVSIESRYSNRSLAITFEGGENRINKEELYTVADGALFIGEFKLDTDGAEHHLSELYSEYENEITLVFNSICEYKTYEDEEFYYISFLYPNEFYDTIIVVDAGHGGWDTGNYAEGYKGLEKDYNLLIASELAAILQEKNVGVYMTRTTDVRLGNEARSELADEVLADYMISIHCDASNDGLSVVYSGEEAKKLALECLKESEQAFKFESNEPLLNSEEDSLLGIANVPTVMVEFDFLTKEEKQKQAAKVLADAILKACEKEGE